MHQNVRTAVRKCGSLRAWPSKNLPYHIEKLHKYTALADENLDNGHLIDAFCMAFRWIEDQGMDPFEIMLKKHQYNKTRPYKHGGKVC